MRNVIENVTVEVLFNGKPAKQYKHNKKLFIESKDGSEYRIHIKNDNAFRIECVIGVDGIDVLSGKQNVSETVGYVINAYSSLKLDGYRISDEQVAAFKFCRRGSGYAESKSINAQNGIITVTCYREKEPVYDLQKLINDVNEAVKKKNVFPIYPWIEPAPRWNDSPFHNPPWNKYEWTWTSNSPDPGPTFGSSINQWNNMSISAVYCNNVTTSRGMSTGKLMRSAASTTPSDCFDMSTTFGQAKESKITTVEFERGLMLGEVNIFYATRDSLKELGVDLTEKQQVVFPVGKKQYCTPPDGWRG